MRRTKTLISLRASALTFNRGFSLSSTLLLLISALLAITLTPLTPASAMGSGDKFLDFQTGVSYGIYKPSNILGLKPLNFESRPCRLFPKKEAMLLAGFGGMDHGISVVQTSAKYNCAGLDNPQSLGTIKINGLIAKVGIYCSTKCDPKTFSLHGGEITFTTLKTNSLAPTFIRVGTQGGFTLKELTTFASSLKIVGTK